jgi:predicted DNA-binding antitoxin AbrB/MazE fold protein
MNMEWGNRNISVDIERNRVRIVISHGEDEEILKLSLEESRELEEKINRTIEDYLQRQDIRID